MSSAIKELARDNDMPEWQVAEAMVRLMARGDMVPPKDTTLEEHILWLMETYPKPENVIGESAKTTPYQRGHDAACRTGEYLGIEREPDCPYPDDTKASIDWLEGYRDGARAMDEAWSRYD